MKCNWISFDSFNWNQFFFFDSSSNSIHFLKRGERKFSAIERLFVEEELDKKTITLIDEDCWFILDSLGTRIRNEVCKKKNWVRLFSEYIARYFLFTVLLFVINIVGDVGDLLNFFEEKVLLWKKKESF